MVAVAQSVEHRIVIPVVVGSIPISHPLFSMTPLNPYCWLVRFGWCYTDGLLSVSVFANYRRLCYVPLPYCVSFFLNAQIASSVFIANVVGDWGV
jgi:hypothetical protein